MVSAQYTIDRDSYSSPNRSSRHGRAISMLVLHATVGSAESSLNWLTIPSSLVSVHYLIDKIGHIYQLVPNDQAAWHAGKAAWKNLDSDAIQDSSIGVELENRNSGRDPYPDDQLEALTWLAGGLVDQYQIEPAMVVRHLDIAIPKGRKTDPAGFPWDAWKRALYAPRPAAVPRYRLPQVGIHHRRECDDAPFEYLNSYTEYGIDVVYSDGVGHLASGLGFVRMDKLERVP